MNQKLKIRAYLMQNFLELDMKKFSDPKGRIFGIWVCLKTKGNFGPKPLVKDLSSRWSRILAPILTNKTLFSQES